MSSTSHNALLLLGELDDRSGDSSFSSQLRFPFLCREAALILIQPGPAPPRIPPTFSLSACHCVLYLCLLLPVLLAECSFMD